MYSGILCCQWKLPIFKANEKKLKKEDQKTFKGYNFEKITKK